MGAMFDKHPVAFTIIAIVLVGLVGKVVMGVLQPEPKK